VAAVLEEQQGQKFAPFSFGVALYRCLEIPAMPATILE